MSGWWRSTCGGAVCGGRHHLEEADGVRLLRGPPEDVRDFVEPPVEVRVDEIAKLHAPLLERAPELAHEHHGGLAVRELCRIVGFHDDLFPALHAVEESVTIFVSNCLGDCRSDLKNLVFRGQDVRVRVWAGGNAGQQARPTILVSLVLGFSLLAKGKSTPTTAYPAPAPNGAPLISKRTSQFSFSTCAK